jgi:hypothetical protein
MAFFGPFLEKTRLSPYKNYDQKKDKMAIPE